MTEKNIHKFFPQPIFQYQIEGYEEHNKNLEETFTVYMKVIKLESQV